MQSRKRIRGFNPRPSISKKLKYKNVDTAVTQDIWKSLPRLTRLELDIEKTIAYSKLFITLSNEDYKYLKTIIKDIGEVINDDKYVFHESWIELRNFHVMDCCIFISFLMINLNRATRNLNQTNSCEIQKPFFLRHSVYAHKSCKVNVAPQNKKTTFRAAMCHVSGLPNFKQVAFQSTDLKDLMSGIAHQLSNWKFCPVKCKISKEFGTAILESKNRLSIALYRLPFLDKQLSLDPITTENTTAIQESNQRLTGFIKRIHDYNNVVTIRDLKDKKDSKPLSQEPAKFPRYSGTTRTSNTAMKHQNSGNAYPSTFNQHHHDRKPRNGYVSNKEINLYCIATVDASMDVLAAKSASQITRIYIKFPRILIDLLYQRLSELRNNSNCNIVILKMQTYHESIPWFESINVEKYCTIVPPPSTIRVISVGGIGENCKRALKLLRTFLENN